MRNRVWNRIIMGTTVLVLMVMAFAGCGQQNNSDGSNNEPVEQEADSNDSTADIQETEEATSQPVAEALAVQFGEGDGDTYTMVLEDNDTARQIAEYVGTADWNLPIYDYEGFENSDVLQYYDIPSRYEVPSEPTQITSEKIGEVYYSDPNRIVLFYKDAEIPGEYTKIGEIMETDTLTQAVEENPVLEGWGNKIISISPMDEAPEVSKAENSDSEVAEGQTEESGLSANEDQEDNQMKITVNGQTFTATLEDNNTAKALVEMLPMTVTMEELNGNEKYYFLSEEIRQENASNPGTINEGDIMCYGSDGLVLFYETHTSGYTYVPIGHIDNVEGYAQALGSGSVEVTFEME